MDKSGLPKPNVSYIPKNPGTLDEKSIKGMICNPIYAGVVPFPQVVSDEAWVQAAAQLIHEEGAEQFLVNMLYMLRQSLETQTEPQVSPVITVTPIPAKEPDTDLIYCYHDDFPMLHLHGAHVCVAEYIFEHLDDAPVVDLLLEPELALVFQNGHTLPLIAPITGLSLYADNEDAFLSHFNGLSVIDVEWHEEGQALILHFGEVVPEEATLEDEIEPLAAYADDPGYEMADQEQEPVDSLALHLDSIRLMTCPYQSRQRLTADEEDF